MSQMLGDACGAPLRWRPGVMEQIVYTCISFFFFQAEDGIRDLTVTGVQTYALPISYIVSGALHGTENLVREVAAPGLAEGFGKITGFRGMPAVQEQPKHVRDVTKARHHHLRLDGIQLKEGFRHAYQGRRRRTQTQSVLH